MIKAKPIVKNKFWILREGDRKVGELNLDQEGYRVKTVRGTRRFDNLDALKKRGIEFDEINIVAGKQSEIDVEGYPAIGTVFNPVWDVQAKLPLYTKEDKSKSQFAAGWYRLKLKNRWKTVQCPKLILLQRNEYQGPFKSNPDTDTFDRLFQ